MIERPWPVVTVIIPVRNEARYIGQTLHQLYTQSYPKDRIEVIVANGLSTDRTADIVKDFASQYPDFDLKLVTNTKRLSSAGRNIAIKQGRGDYFLLIDGHVYIPTEHLISDGVRLATDKKAHVLGRMQPLSPPGLTRFQEAVAFARQSFLSHSGESYIHSEHEGWVSPISVGVMYERSLFNQVGMFDETFDAAEDVEFNYRLEKHGFLCYMSPSLAVYYYPRNSVAAVFKQLMRYGYGRASFVCKHPERFTFETAVPSFWLISLVMLSVLGLASSLFWILMVAAMALYILVLFGESARLNFKHNKRYFMEVPLVIIAIHAGFGVGFIKGFLVNVGKKITGALRLEKHST